MTERGPAGAGKGVSGEEPALKSGKMAGKLNRILGELGPGLITGAADDDPSGISTYSMAGASFGYALLWTPLFTFPLMAAVQLMCARLGLVTGLGLAGIIRRRYPRPVLWLACLLLVIANTVNIAADLAGMGEAMEMMSGISGALWLPLFAVAIVGSLIWSSYRQLARVFKWLTLVLFAYVIAAFFSQPNWLEVLRAAILPQIAWDSRYLAMFVGIMGTTISPYLFFWQAGEEVEEERALGRRTVKQRRGATDQEMRAAQTDVLTGMAFAGVVMFFIILTTGSTLHATGQREIETARQAAEALRPLAGDTAYLLFTVGLVGAGMLGVPILAGSAAYAIAEAMHWRGSLNDPPRMAWKFYAVLAAAVFIGLGLDYLRFNAVRMLFWAALLNGILAPPLVALVTLLSSDPRVMGDRVSPRLLQWLGWCTFAVMAGAAIYVVASWL